MDPVIIEQAGEAMAHTDFSLLALFFRADWVVQLVMLGLIFASILSWAIIIEKWRKVRRFNKLADIFETQFWSGGSIQQLYKDASAGPEHPLSGLFVSAMREWSRADTGKNGKITSETEQLIDRALTRAIGREVGALESRMLFLATVGAVAPFIGLFGTVWGIMNSFQAIALSRDTNLAVVAPGIAEALFATGLGLLAAIPAVIAYNAFNASIMRLGGRMDIFADDFIGFIRRHKEKG